MTHYTQFVSTLFVASIGLSIPATANVANCDDAKVQNVLSRLIHNRFDQEIPGYELAANMLSIKSGIDHIKVTFEMSLEAFAEFRSVNLMINRRFCEATLNFKYVATPDFVKKLQDDVNKTFGVGSIESSIISSQRGEDLDQYMDHQLRFSFTVQTITDGNTWVQF